MKTLEEKRAYDKAKSAKYRAENPEKSAASQAKWRAANYEKEVARMAKWRAENSKKIKASQAKYLAENHEEIAESQAKYCAELHDTYIKKLLRIENAPPELIEMKRQQIFNRRLMKQLNEVIQQGITK